MTNESYSIDVKANLSSLKGQVSGILKEIGKINSGLGAQADGVKSKLGNIIGTAKNLGSSFSSKNGGGILNGLSASFDAAKSAAGGLGNYVGNVAKGMGSAFAGAGIAAGSVGASAIKGFAGFNLNFITRAIAGATSTIANSAVGIGTSLVHGINTGISAGGKIIAAGLGAVVTSAATGVGWLGKQAIVAEANIQQSVGGIDAVFKSNSKTMQSWAAGAAGAMGLSANSVMESANKMGAILQGSGISLQQSTNMTQNYIQRASDVASVMGISMSDALLAVTDAAKGNFTMMDNLGVPMTAATLSAYALTKGIKSQWNTMDSGTKSMIAYEYFMEKSAYATGNFASESTTLSGAFEILKASWGNVLASMSNADMMPAATAQLDTALNNMNQAIMTVLPNLISGMGTFLTTGVSGISKLIVAMIPGITSVIVQSAPQLLAGISQVAVQIVGQLQSLLITLLPVVSGQLASFIGVLANTITTLGPQLASQLPTVLNQVISDVNSMAPQLISVFQSIFIGMLEGAAQILNGLGSILLAQLPNILASLQSIYTVIGAFIINGMTGIANAMPTIVSDIVAVLPNLANVVIQTVGSIMSNGVSIIGTLVTGILPVLVNSIPTISSVLYQVLNSIVDVIANSGPVINQVVPTLVASLLNAIVLNLPVLLDGILGVITALANAIEAALPTLIAMLPAVLQSLFDSIMEFIKGMLSVEGTYFQQILGAIGEVLVILGQFIMNNLPSLIDYIANGVAGLIDQLPALMNRFVTWFQANSGSILAGLGTVLIDLTNGLGKMLGALFRALPSVILAIMKTVLSTKFILGFVGMLGDVLVAIVKNLIAMIPDIIVSLALIVVEIVKAAFIDIPAAVVSIGYNIIRGVIVGLFKAIPELFNAIKRIAGNIINWFKNLLGIHSPSKISAELGVFWMKGLSNGMKSEQKNAMGVWTSIASGFTGSVFDATRSGAQVSPANGGTVIVQQTVAAPRSLRDIYLQTQDGAKAGLQVIGL